MPQTPIPLLADPDFKHVAIAGNIGSGKTTLAQQLARHYNWEPHFEEVENNPYIDDFYQDMQRWSFHIQVHYLYRRFQQILEIRKGHISVVQDRTIYEDACIFAPNLHEMRLMSERDYNTYQNLYQIIESMIEPPDLLIYLRADLPTLVSQIQKRGRKFEDYIRLDYLKRLNDRYERWAGEYRGRKMIVVDVEKYNFADDAEQLGEVVNMIERERGSSLFGSMK